MAVSVHEIDHGLSALDQIIIEPDFFAVLRLKQGVRVFPYSR
jgi:hypothetical protein